MKYARSSNDAFVNEVLYHIFYNKNRSLFKELKGVYHTNSSCDYTILKNERPLLFSLIKNLEVVMVNNSWKGPNRAAFRELFEQETMINPSLIDPNFSDELDESSMFQFTTMGDIRFMDIVLRKSLCEGNKDHMWMAYYQIIMTRLVLVVDQWDDNRDIKTFLNTPAFKMMSEIIENIYAWVIIAEDRNSNLVDRIYQLMFECVYEISKSHKLDVDAKSKVVKHFFYNYFEANDRNKKINEIEIFNKYALRPSIVFPTDKNEFQLHDRSYVEMINKSFSEIDDFDMWEYKNKKYTSMNETVLSILNN
jgi:hypothetical protein